MLFRSTPRVPGQHSTRSGGPETPIRPSNLRQRPGKPWQNPQCAPRGEDSLLCPGMRRAPQPRPQPKPTSPGCGGSRCHPLAGPLTCRGAGPGDSGEKRGDGKQPQQAPTLRVPPARSGGGRDGEAAGRSRGEPGRGAASPTFVPSRSSAGRRAPRTATGSARGPLAFPAGNKGGAGQGQRQRQRRAGSGPRPESPAL